MRSVVEHQAVVAALFDTPRPVRVSLPEALGLASLADVEAPLSLPGFDNSAMDGFAVRAADLADATEATPVTLPVAADIPAGRTDDLTLAPGTAHRIMTGAPMPTGADAVVPVELTDAVVGPVAAAATVTFTAPVEAGRHIRRAGSDIERGTRALPAGTVIGAPQIGLLAALGIADITVARPLRVVVLSTGSELVEPGNPLRHGQIYESNGAMLTAAATESGALGRHVHFVPDDTGDFLSRLGEVADSADLIITSGGVSAGAFEVVKDALSATGSVDFVKVAMQPGMPQGCGHFAGPRGSRVPIITLPGNPVSALVSFEVFIRPALRAAMALPAHRERVSARLGADIRSPRGKRQFLRGVLGEAQPGSGIVVNPIGPPASHHLRYLAEADALIDVPADADGVAAGSQVDVLVLR
ncbi:molybdopterin molybdotransferase MoeA [Gordonia sp. zg691]|uniref:Molybdopterin molybdenumtransferase n=1 Tax=Gordonia jinghuaiqii TaxID=2758710 RepID=A0A7D7QQH4_9ACTN|nr:gephyrin-like molybdotransferase Glp [Gordonia jinghuaiqii]MBD0861583.1 molybdopterin molybdotransferase MoeA [Gordonia jinghuaiqii]MCR5977454.1 molybdopterin molybdenumtransferase MoeA [Gordonia jinghuaiqii]QMT02146.1 molybdopterin molybdotransferase MoeA [Gordonia jinghuaiqii]